MGCIAIMMSELQEIRNVYQGLETLYQTYLPKVDPELLHDLLIREEEKSERAPFYMVEAAEITATIMATESDSGIRF